MCKCTPEIRTPFCGKVGCQWTDPIPENSYNCAAEGCQTIVMGGGTRPFCEIHKKSPSLATVDFVPPRFDVLEQRVLANLTQEEIDELVSNRVGNIASWFCSDYIKETSYRMLKEIIERRKNDRVPEVSEK